MIWLAGLKNNLILVGLLAVAGSLGFLYIRVEMLKKTNENLELQVQQKEQQFSALSEQFSAFQTEVAVQSEKLNNVYSQNAEVRKEVNNALKIFERHNLQQLSQKKPELIELRVNRATEEVFKTIETETSEFQSKMSK